jgi:tetratricopeptide (TPR) repeat protein
VGGSVSGSTISIACGISPEQLDALVRHKTRDLADLSATQRELITSLRNELKLNQGQVQAALGILGEAHVPVEQLATKLVEVAERFKALQATATAQPGDDPKVTALKAEAQKVVETGDLAKADHLLGQIKAIQKAALSRLALEAAETSAQQGQVALTRLRYLEAAEHFSEAASLVPRGNDDKRLGYLDREAAALYQQGWEFGDNAAALRTIERYRQLLALRPRERVPLDWARTQVGLGNALWTLGERESSTH